MTCDIYYPSDLPTCRHPRTFLILHRFGPLEVCDKPKKLEQGTPSTSTLCRLPLLPSNTRSESAAKPIPSCVDDRSSSSQIVFAMSVSPGSGIIGDNLFPDKELLSSLRASQEASQENCPSSTGKALSGTVLCDVLHVETYAYTFS